MGTKSRMNIHVHSCSAVYLSQLKCAIYNMTVYHCTSYSVVVVSIVQLPMYVIAFRSTILLEGITSVSYMKWCSNCFQLLKHLAHPLMRHFE